MEGGLPVRHLVPRILMAVDCCGCQLRRKLLLAEHASFKKEGTTTDSGEGKHSLQHDGRPDWRFGSQFGMWKIGSVSGNGDVCADL